MATPEALGSARTSSAPCFHNGMIWYQEDGSNRLMVMPMDDPSKAFNPGGLKTLSEPVLAQGRYITFRGEDDRLMLVTADAPHMHGQLGDQHCLSAPVPSGDGYLYFQGRGNSLSRCRLDRDEHSVLTENKRPIVDCLDRPAVSAREHRIAYRGLCSYVQGETIHVIDTTTGKGIVPAPCNGVGFYTAPDGVIWYVSFGRLLYIPKNPLAMYFLNRTDPIRPCATPYGIDNKIYFVKNGDLCRMAINSLSDTLCDLIAKGCATPPDVQIGFVLYGGADKKLYKVALGGAQS